MIFLSFWTTVGAMRKKVPFGVESAYKSNFFVIFHMLEMYLPRTNASTWSVKHN